MTPALIDLHVRPVLNEAGHHDAELLAVQARDHGLDGLAVIGHDEPVTLGDTAELSQATGVLLFAGVELATDAGRLVCFPKAMDDWYAQAGWKSLPRAGASTAYDAQAVVKAFAERGGAVVSVAGVFDGEAPERPQGLAALDVTAETLAETPDDDEEDAAPAEGTHAGRLHDGALEQAAAAHLACVAGSRAIPGEARFGAVATVFAAPPVNQASLVEGLRSGRVWPVEIGAAWADAALMPRRGGTAQAAAGQAHAGGGQQGSGQYSGAQYSGGQAGAMPSGATPSGSAPSGQRDPAARDGERSQRPAQGQQFRKNSRYFDPNERPGDSRGNRLNREALRRRIAAPADDYSQPAFDPVAAMYGLDGRKFLRHVGKSDVELDRINGNRAKGPDTNVMVLPAFDELRQERQHINLLFCQTDDDDQEEDSLSLALALSYFHDEDGQPTRDLSQLPAAHPGRKGQRRRRR